MRLIARVASRRQELEQELAEPGGSGRCVTVSVWGCACFWECACCACWFIHTPQSWMRQAAVHPTNASCAPCADPWPGHQGLLGEAAG